MYMNAHERIAAYAMPSHVERQKPLGQLWWISMHTFAQSPASAGCDDGAAVGTAISLASRHAFYSRPNPAAGCTGACSPGCGSK